MAVVKRAAKALALSTAIGLAAASLGEQAWGQPAQQAVSVPVDRTLAPYASAKDSVRLSDGRMLHLVCMGKGSPLVILTPGGNDWAMAWNKVQPAVAQKTRVCAWERAGAGLSDPPAKPQTVAETASDLQEALKAAHLSGPYVVVGHSRGAGESLLLKDREPSQVAGMVLVDPAVPGWRAIRDRVAPAVSEYERANPDPGYALLTKCAAQVRAGTARVGGPDPDGCLRPPQFPPFFPPELRAALEQHFNALTAEQRAQAMETAAAQLDDNFPGPDSRASVMAGRNYGNMPLIVLTAGSENVSNPNLPTAVRQGLTASDAEYKRQHDALASLSTRGVNRVVPNTNHFIPQMQPQAVINAIGEVVDQVRASERPRPTR